MNIYIAGRFGNRELYRSVQSQIWQKTKHSVISAWLRDTHTHETLPSDQWATTAMRDLKDIRESHLLILDTLQPVNRGGREVEYGYAISRGIPTWRVGPIRSVFHAMADRDFDSWDEVVHALHEELSLCYQIPRK